MTITAELIIDETLIENFARVTGDFSSIHMDAEFARRSRYRQRVAHGMILISMLNVLAEEQAGNSLRLRHLEGTFSKPVFPGTRVRMTIEVYRSDSDGFAADAVWTDATSSKVLCRANAAYALAPNRRARSETTACLVPDELVEAELDIGAMQTASATFAFCLAEGLTAKLLRTTDRDSPASHSLVSALMLSPLVGMLLPGRAATFLNFRIGFAAEPNPDILCTMSARTIRINTLSGSADVEFKIGQSGNVVASGTLATLVNAMPFSQPTYREFVSEHALLRLDRRTAIVIGGSRGIGEATAKLLAALGANVVITYFQGQQDAQRIATEVGIAGGTIVARHCDVRHETDVRQLIDATVVQYGGLDILVNNAVFGFMPTPFDELKWDDFSPELDVSLKGLHLACENAVPIMKKNGGGKIINLSSTIVSTPVSGQLRYITAKSAIVGYTKALAKEIGRYNIQVNLVTPSMTETDLVAGIPAEIRKRLAESNSAKRNINTYQVAQAIAFLASNWSDTMNGQQITLNMGQPPFAT